MGVEDTKERRSCSPCSFRRHFWTRLKLFGLFNPNSSLLVLSPTNTNLEQCLVVLFLQ